MKITEDVIEQVEKDVQDLMRCYQLDLDTAYLKHGDKFQVKFASTIEPAKSGDGLTVETEISFRPEPDVKDKTGKTTVGASQRVLPFKAKRSKHRPWAMAYGKEQRCGVGG
ncbi:MAG: hypothetical protein ABIG67_05840 [Pseudomonadota bacterium]